MKLKAFSLTDPGRVRQNNEDRCLVDESLGLYIVCDGMGGHAGGEVAAQEAVQTAAAFIARESSDPNKRGQLQPEQLSFLCEGAVQAASQRLYELSHTRKELARMGSTFTLLLVRGQSACVAHVGDSRLYLLRGAQVHQLTRDHTVVQELVDDGTLSEEQAKCSDFRHVLSRALGASQYTRADTLVFDLLPGDKLLLCSDGLHGLLGAPELGEVFRKHKIDQVAAALVHEANERGGEDNITAIVIEAEPESITANERSRADTVILTFDSLQHVFLFNKLELSELLRVVEKCTLIDCRKGEMVVEEGGVANQLYIILSGKFAVIKDGWEVATLGHGNHFGEMGLLADRPRTASVQALEDGQLLTLSQDELFGFLRLEPRIGVQLLWQLAKELSRRLDERDRQDIDMASAEGKSS